MAEYAHIAFGKITQLHDINPSTYAEWVSKENPKAQAYRPVVTLPMPSFDPVTHVAIETMTVESSRVVRGWTVRTKTADEQRQVWTAYQFLGRFTDPELMAIRAESQTDPATWKFLTFATAAQEVVSDDPMTVAGMNYLVSIGIVTEARKNQILAP